MDELRRRRRARVIGLTTIAAAAVGTGILIAGNLGGLTSAPAAGGGVGAPASTASPPPPAPAACPSTPAPAANPRLPAPAAAGPAAEAGAPAGPGHRRARRP